MYQDFRTEGFSGKEAFELLKMFVGPHYAMVVQGIHRAGVAREAAAAARNKGPDILIPRPQLR